MKDLELVEGDGSAICCVIHGCLVIALKHCFYASGKSRKVGDFFNFPRDNPRVCPRCHWDFGVKMILSPTSSYVYKWRLEQTLIVPRYWQNLGQLGNKIKCLRSFGISRLMCQMSQMSGHRRNHEGHVRKKGRFWFPSFVPTVPSGLGSSGFCGTCGIFPTVDIVWNSVVTNKYLTQ